MKQGTNEIRIAEPNFNASANGQLRKVRRPLLHKGHTR